MARRAEIAKRMRSLFEGCQPGQHIKGFVLGAQRSESEWDAVNNERDALPEEDRGIVTVFVCCPACGVRL